MTQNLNINLSADDWRRVKAAFNAEYPKTTAAHVVTWIEAQLKARVSSYDMQVAVDKAADDERVATQGRFW